MGNMKNLMSVLVILATMWAWAEAHRLQVLEPIQARGLGIKGQAQVGSVSIGGNAGWRPGKNKNKNKNRPGKGSTSSGCQQTCNRGVCTTTCHTSSSSRPNRPNRGK